MADSDGSESPKNRVPQPVFLGLLWTLTGLSFIFDSFRIAVHIHSFRRLWIDDALSIISWIIMLAAAVMWQVEGGILYQIYAVSDGLEEFSLDFAEKYVYFLRFTTPYQMLLFTGLWCIKFGFMIFFYRLRSKVRTHQIRYWVVLFFTVVVYILCMGLIEYKCSFSGADYILNECPKINHIHYEQRTFYVMCAGDVVTGLMILSVPIVTLWNTRISRRDKMVLFSIFSATLLVMIISILRVSVNTSLNTPVDPGWLIFWSFIEINTAIIISCAVSLRQIFVKSKQQSPRPSAGSSNLTPRKSYPKVHQRSIGDLESHDNEDILLSSMSDVHVRHEFEVVSTSAAESADDQTLSPQKKSFA